MLTSIEMRKRYVIYLRAILSLTIVLIALYNYSVYDVPFVISTSYIAILFLSNIGFMLLPGRMYKGIKLHYLIFLLDIAFLVVGAFIFTQMNLAFLIAIFLTIFMAALSQSVGVSLAIALVVGTIYLYIMYVTGGETYNFFNDKTLLNLPFMFVVALHSSYLAEKANEELSDRKTLEKINLLLTKKMVSKSEQLSAVSMYNEILLDSFTTGVIILDEEGFVRIFNKASERIFAIKKEKAVNISIKDLNLPQGIKDSIMDLQFKKSPVNDFVMQSSINNSKKIAITTSFIGNSKDENIGILCVIREVVES